MLFEQAYDPIRSLKAAWDLLKRTPGTILVGVLMPVAVQYALGFVMQIVMLPMMFAMQRQGAEPNFGFLAVMIPMAVILSIVQLVFMTWIDIGVARAIRAALATGQEQIRLIFGGWDRLGTLLLARLLIGLVCLVIYGFMIVALLILGALFSTSQLSGVGVVPLLGVMFAFSAVLIYVLLGLQFVTPIVAFEDCSATAAIGRSWKIADGRRWKLIVFWLFCFVLSIAGVLACFVGLLLALPLIETMRIEAFVAMRYPKPVIAPEPESWSSSSTQAPPPMPPPLPPQT